MRTGVTFTWNSPQRARCVQVIIRLALILWLCVPAGPALWAGPGSEITNGLAAVDSPFRQVVLLGASVSAGWTETEPLGGPKSAQYRLNRFVDAALAVPHQPPRNLASTLFFVGPEGEGRRQINEALKAKPSLVLGIDFLFWFCYGKGPGDADRLRRFETGLKLLEELPCPVVVGDIPDASAAVNRMLSPDQIPTPRALELANRRLRRWAAAHRNVTVLPLASFMRSVLANRAVKVHGHRLAAGTTRGLLQDDRLHPSPSGAAFLAVALLDAFEASRHNADAAGVRWDTHEVLRLGLAPRTPDATARK